MLLAASSQTPNSSSKPHAWCLAPAGSDTAARSALAFCNDALIHDHIDRRLGHSLRANGSKGEAVALRELRSITKYLSPESRCPLLGVNRT
jgi:hypothetical protein